MANENLINNDKPFETVYELKEEYKTPSFEEFMETYEHDSNLNYDDLDVGSLGEVKRHGPCPNGCYERVRNGITENVYYKTPERMIITGSLGGCTCDASSRFCLNIKCHNWAGDGANRYACSTSQALQHAHDLEDGN